MATLTDETMVKLEAAAKAAQSNRAALDVVRAINPKVADWLAAADPQTVLALIERLREAEAQIGEEVTPKPEPEPALIERLREAEAQIGEEVTPKPEPEPEQPTVSCDDIQAYYDLLKPWPHTRFQGRDVLRGPEPEVTTMTVQDLARYDRDGTGEADLRAGLRRCREVNGQALASLATGQPVSGEPTEPTDGELLDALEGIARDWWSQDEAGELSLVTMDVPVPESMCPLQEKTTLRNIARAIIAAQRGGEVVTISREELGKQPEEQAARREALKPHLTQFQGRDVLHDAAQRGGKE